MCHPAWGRALTEAMRAKDLALPRRDRIEPEQADPVDAEAFGTHVSEDLVTLPN